MAQRSSGPRKLRRQGFSHVCGWRTGSILLAACLMLATPPAMGVILHDDAQQPPAEQHPPDAVVGRWDTNASAVAIGPDLIITTRHQFGGLTTDVEFGGTTYNVVQQYSHPTADLRVCRIDGTLTDYVGFYDTSETGKPIVIGGYGDIRGAELTTPDPPYQVYGYEWSGGTNTNLRWGTNVVDTASTSTAFKIYSSDAMRADFDQSGTTYEASIADHDSGGGWFLWDTATSSWKIVGLGEQVETHEDPPGVVLEQTWFRNPSGGADPDRIWAVRVTSYVDWIGRWTGAGPHMGDANGDGAVDVSDLSILAGNYRQTGNGFGWTGGDLNGDGAIDISDLALLAGQYRWSTGGSSAPSLPAGEGGAPVPEPATAAVLVIGAGILLLRRARRR